MKSAVLLLSSGLDSAANLALAEQSGFDIRVALTVRYGQRGVDSEVEHAAKLAKHFGIEHIVFDLSAFVSLAGGNSALLGGQDVPVPTSLDDFKIATQTAKAVWVPNRNGVFLSLAAALAEARGLSAVAVGFNAEEAVTFADNSKAYMQAMTASLGYSTANHVEIVSATVDFTKTQIVRALVEKDFPFHLIWSCYFNAKADTNRHCGQCESCQRLRRAVEQGLNSEHRAAVLRELFSC